MICINDTAPSAAHHARAMTDDLFRLLMQMTRRYSRDPQTRATASGHILRAAVALHAANTSAAEAALTAAEAVATPAAQERRSA